MVSDFSISAAVSGLELCDTGIGMKDNRTITELCKNEQLARALRICLEPESVQAVQDDCNFLAMFFS